MAENTFSFRIDAVASAPDWLHDRLDQGRAHSGGVVSEREIELDDPANVDRCIQVLRNRVEARDIAIEGKASDEKTYKLFCVLRDNGVSQETAVELVWDHYIPHCLPEGAYDHEWVASKAENAFEYAQSTEGVWAPGDMAAEFSELIAASKAEFRKYSAELIPFNDFINDTVPPVEEIVMDWVEKGIPNFIAGRGGSHKSRIALQWGLCAQGGLQIFGKQPARVTLVYLSSEDDKAEITRRSQAICRQLTVAALDGALLMDRKGKPSALCAMDEGAKYVMSSFYDQLADTLRSVQGHKLVVMDSCVDFVHFLGRAKIDDGSVNFFIKGVLQRLCDETDSTLLVIWHSSKSGQDTGAGWSVAWEDAPRSRMLMKATENGTVELVQTKRNHGKLHAPVELRYDGGALVPVDPNAADVGGLKPWLIKLAISQAMINVPFQRTRNVEGWVQERAEKEFGYRPSLKQLKGILEEAVRNKMLRYRSGGSGVSAGYAAWDGEEPADVIEEVAATL